MFGNSGIIPLPRPLERRVDTLGHSFMRQRLGSQMDFLIPQGEPALLPPNSVSWRIFRILLRCSSAGLLRCCSNWQSRAFATPFGSTAHSAPTRSGGIPGYQPENGVRSRAR